jgi:hypothetical protein
VQNCPYFHHRKIRPAEAGRIFKYNAGNASSATLATAESAFANAIRNSFYTRQTSYPFDNFY